mmetsp:Transcript_90973/g.253199  ORF Transcript_90973/g.253199 Transcript_90973/m.253199 type:complete len:242 (-) Transcript_90973:274-999(-)
MGVDFGDELDDILGSDVAHLLTPVARDRGRHRRCHSTPPPENARVQPGHVELADAGHTPESTVVKPLVEFLDIAREEPCAGRRGHVKFRMVHDRLLQHNADATVRKAKVRADNEEDLAVCADQFVAVKADASGFVPDEVVDVLGCPLSQQQLQFPDPDLLPVRNVHLALLLHRCRLLPSALILGLLELSPQLSRGVRAEPLPDVKEVPLTVEELQHQGAHPGVVSELLAEDSLRIALDLLA